MTASIIFSIIGLIAAANTMDSHVVIRTSIPVTITVVLSFLYAKTIKQHKYALKQEANRDYLTGIYNRRNISQWLQQKISSVNNDMLALYFIDVDDFKRVNDNYGHAVGDQLLVEISQRLARAVYQFEPNLVNIDYKVARLAGDEFLVAISGLNHKDYIELFGKKLLEEVNQSVSINDLTLDIHTSIGVSTTNDNSIESATLLNQADIAMFEAKKKGKNRIGYFNQTLADQLTQKNAIAQAIKESLEHHRFFLNFMPIYDASTTKITGAEALIRNEHPSFKGLGPDTYIQIAEEYGLILEIDLFVIERCFKYLKDLLPKLNGKPFVLAINISSLELKNKHFPQHIKQLADKYQIPPSVIELEITETSLVDYNEESIHVLQCLKDMGYKLSLDDFGTGYTAFNQLQHYPVDTLKIDRSFIWAIEKNNNEKGFMVDVIISLAKIYQLNVVAEGVEEPFQLEYLKALGCSHYQGYLLSKPVDWVTLKSLL